MGTRIAIQFQVFSYDTDNQGTSDSHSRQFEFKGSFEDAKKFLDDIMDKQVKLQEEESKKDLPY